MVRLCLPASHSRYFSHIPFCQTSGTAALAYSIWLGKRRGWGTENLSYRPNNVSHVVIGTVFVRQALPRRPCKSPSSHDVLIFFFPTQALDGVVRL